MALLSQMFRTAAITGDASRANAWFADRQGKEWAERTVQGAFPQHAAQQQAAPQDAAPPADPAKALASLDELRRSGVIDDAELSALRARVGV
jgi:hypothetical protein